MAATHCDRIGQSLGAPRDEEGLQRVRAALACLTLRGSDAAPDGFEVGEQRVGPATTRPYRLVS